ncbi:hypothetical protein [Brumimicrobium oceani]|uniref:Uncharacterized protein n=1 Tax=Brumimicrobium oceani TaxID=2100725 RepID=A0A2U2XD50_9FLAO|nr:hypothetical protein [Brumimicrobium oceani]PWH85725.1 hypothetical protein DIT68_08820 [Brumimicrobium oceani]
MTKKAKVTIIAIFLLAGMVTLFFYLSKKKSKSEFQLIEYVSEKDIAYHTNFIELIEEAIRYNSKVEKSITNNIALNELKSKLVKSGLKLENTYITYSLAGEKYGSVYLEVTDAMLFESAFTQLSDFFNFRRITENANLYISGNTAVSAEKHAQFIKINFGDGALNALSEPKNKSSAFFRKLLEKPNLGIINTTGSSALDSTDYATFSYAYTDELSFTLDWKVTKNHPLKVNQNTTIPVYPSQKNKINATINLDLEHLTSNLNPYLKEKGGNVIDLLPPALMQLLTLWNGEASLQLGGKSAQETIQYVTEFDDNFNQVETKIVKVDSVPDVGMYWGTQQAEKSLSFLYQLPNVRADKGKLQVALLPSLFTKTEPNSLKVSTQSIAFENQETKDLLYLKSDIPGIIGELKAKKTSTQNLRISLILKDWSALRDPEKLKFSTFW